MTRRWCLPWAIGLLLSAGGCGGSDSEVVARATATAAFPATWSHEGRCADEDTCATPVPLSDLITGALGAGHMGLQVMRAVVASRTCPLTFRRVGAGGQLDALQSPETRVKLAQDLQTEDRSRSEDEALGEWLLLVAKYTEACKQSAIAEDLYSRSRDLAVVVAEPVVDRALRSGSCSTLIMIQRMSLWPFERRFAAEIADKDFATAEVTRRVWLDTLDRTAGTCKDTLSRREAIEIDASREKLQRIVGLDDSMLVDLRSKLLDAMARNDSAAVEQYAHAVNEREQVVDSRHAADYQARLDKMQADLQAARSAAASGTPQPGAGVTGAIATANGVIDTADNAINTANKAVNTANKAVQTVEKAKQTVQIARSLFGL